MRRLSRDFIFGAVLILVAIIAIAVFIIHRYQILNTPLVITSGGAGRPYHKLALRYKDFLERNGVNVQVRTSEGSIKNLEQLRDPASGVKAALIQGGITTQAKAAGLLSMGRVLTEPVWVYVNCADAQKIQSLEDLRGKRLLVGGEGSGTRYLARQLLADYGVDDRNSYWLQKDAKQFLEKSPGEPAADAGFLVVAADLRDPDPTNPQDIKQLARGKCLLNMADAEGMVQRFPFLHKVVLHRGAFDLKDTLPRDDIALVATKAALVVRQDLDSALQNLLAQAVAEVQSSPGDDAKFFPLLSSSLAEDDPEFTLSSEARRVYRAEQTFFQRLLPFWIATFLDDVILYVLALPFITIVVQLFRVVPFMRDFIIRRRRDGVHAALNELNSRLGAAASAPQIEEIAAELARIEAQVNAMALPAPVRFELKRHVDLVRRDVEAARRRVRN
jgi:TRAP-type uncharacterized transport system substrate-binding protein